LFDGRAPSDLLDTDEGIQLVEQTLIRIDTTCSPDAARRLSGLPRCARPSRQFGGQNAPEVGGILGGIANRVTPTVVLSVIKEDPDDDRILACAAEAKSDFIVSEDKHLLRLGHFSDARIVTIRDFFQRALAHRPHR
jgi:hypothetical protein